MSSFWTIRNSRAHRIPASQQSALESPHHARISNFLDFFAFYLAKDNLREAGLHPVLINASPTFSDTSMEGASFEVRKVATSSFYAGLGDALLKGRSHVVTKQPRLAEDHSSVKDWDEMATEIHILNETGVRNNPHIIDLIGLIFYDSGSDSSPLVIPASVLEYAEYGNITDFQRDGRGHSPQDKYDMCRDIATGLSYLHNRGIIHGDVKSSNMLVCKHSERKFVVKLSDFGYAMLLSDPELSGIGYSRFWEAPEVHQLPQRRFLPQLDMYSYGILVYTILKNGALYYEALPDDEKDEHILKLKTTNLIGELFQMNLLNDSRQGDSFLLLFCRTLRYCLRANPSERFADMNTILLQLAIADPRYINRELVNHQRPQILEMITNSPGFPRLPDSVLSNTAMIKTVMMHVFEQASTSYLAAIRNESSPLLDALRSLYHERMQYEIAMLHLGEGGPAGPLWTQEHLVIALARILIAFRPMTALSCDSGVDTQAATPSHGAHSHCEAVKFVNLDMNTHHRIVQKMHPIVQQYIAEQLRLCSTSPQSPRQAQAAFNLGICHINGLGLKYDVDLGLARIHEAAVAGNTVSRQYLLRVYTADEGLRKQHAGEHSAWGAQFDAPEVRAWFLQHDYAAYSRWRNARMVKAMKENIERDRYRDEDSSDADVAAARHTLLLNLCTGLDLHLQLQRMIEDDPRNLRWTNAFGQSLLIVACQNGSFETAIMLLAQKDINVNAEDCDGITALHWLISFPPNQAQILGVKLIGLGANIDVHARTNMSNFNMKPNLYGSPIVRGTPLTWAVASSNMYCLDIHLALGADPCDMGDGNLLSALNHACLFSSAPSVLKFKNQSGFTRAVQQYQPLDANRIVNTLFWALLSTGRANRLAAHGRTFEKQQESLLRALIEDGASCEAVMISGSARMSAAFATAWHQCDADVMQSGLKCGFRGGIDATFQQASSGGPAMSLAIAHQDLDMLRHLIRGGAACNWRNMYNVSVMSLAAKETNNVEIFDTLIEAGAPINDVDAAFNPFFAAVYAGHLIAAKHLWERGADRDAFTKGDGKNILGALITMRTRNAIERIKFVLRLPDRGKSDGFMVLNVQEPDFTHQSSALHVLFVPYFTGEPFDEDPEVEQRSCLTLAALLEKYSDTKYLNSTMGPHHDVPLGMAAEVGNQHGVRMLLEAGADPNGKDEYNRSPLDRALWRYCYPATLDVLKELEPDDRLEVGKRLNFVNRNSREIVNLLQSYGGVASCFQFPTWYAHDSGLRSLDWVMARLAESRSRPPVAIDQPIWGGLPITIPERPMQWQGRRAAKPEESTAATGDAEGEE